MTVIYDFRVLTLEACKGFIMSSELHISILSVFTMSFNLFPKEEPVVEKMAPLSCFEVSGPEMLEMDPVAMALFEKIGWKPFFWSFNGHNEEVTR